MVGIVTVFRPLIIVTADETGAHEAAAVASLLEYKLHPLTVAAQDNVTSETVRSMAMPGTKLPVTSNSKSKPRSSLLAAL